MSNYTKSTNFAAKDALASGNPLKIVKGTEIDTEFNNIATAVATKTDNASAAITGGTIAGAAITAGTINNTPIGGTTTNTAAFSSVGIGGAALPAALFQIGLYPTSTAENAHIYMQDGSDISNNSYGLFGINSTAVAIFSGKTGTGSYKPLEFWTGGAKAAFFDTSRNFIQFTNTTAATLTAEGHMTISRVNNTTLKLSLRGTDGVTRSVNLTLS